MLITWDANLYLEVLNFDTFLTVPYEFKIMEFYYIRTSLKNIFSSKMIIFNEKSWIFNFKWQNSPDSRNISTNLGHFVTFKSDNFERQIKIILSNLNIEISESETMSFYEVSDFTKENTFTDLAEGPAVDKVNTSKIVIFERFKIDQKFLMGP